MCVSVLQQDDRVSCPSVFEYLLFSGTIWTENNERLLLFCALPFSIMTRTPQDDGRRASKQYSGARQIAHGGSLLRGVTPHDELEPHVNTRPGI